MATLKMLEACRVTSFINSSTPVVEFSLPFTYFDIMWLKVRPIEQIFFYQLTPNKSTDTFFNSVILSKLKHSLSITLNHFLPIAGNIIWPVDTIKPFILYSLNDGVSLIVVESNSDFNHLIKNEMQEAIDLRPYVPELPVHDSKAAIIAFQITFFPSQGFSIGISGHHAALDGKSAAMFMKSWAHICKANLDMSMKLPLHLTPFFDRKVLLDYPQEFDMLYLNDWLKPGLDANPKSLKLLEARSNFENLVRANFEFSRQDINKLREKVVFLLNEEEDDTTTHMHLSAFVLSLAYTFVCIFKAKMLERKGKICLAFIVDCRSRLDPPVPTNYIGSCLILCPMLIDVEAITDSGEASNKVGHQGRMKLNGIAFVAKKLSEKIKGLEKRLKKISIEQEKEIILELRRARENSDVLLIGVAWSPKFEIYNGTNFGWGNPKKMQIVHIDNDGSISMTESRNDNGGIEIGLVMERHEMELFNSLFVNGLRDFCK